MYIFIILLLIIVIGFFVLSRDNRVDREIKSVEMSGLKKGGKIVQISDLHYLSSRLTDYGKSYNKKIGVVDAKPVKNVDKILDSLILEVIEIKPDVLIISGDITFNGERASHEEVSSKLNILKDKGIQVLVIPGNHDIDSQRSNSYFGDEIETVENIDSNDFSNIYNSFVMGENKRIVSRDNHSLSYLYKLSSNVNLLLLDTNSGKNINEVSNGTLKWIEKILKYTSSRNEIVISVSHQNILIHNKMFASGYRIKNASSIIELYKKYNVRLNLSGHMHLQHISQYNGVYDISIGSIGLYPHIYAVVDIDDVNTIEYFTEKLSISKWMEKYGYKDDTLVNFENFSREKFRENVLMQSSKVFSGEKTIGKFKKEDIEKMMEFMVDSSVSYFSGEIYKNPQLRKDNPTLKMWLEHFSDEFQVKYLESIYTDDVLRNHNEITIKQ